MHSLKYQKQKNKILSNTPQENIIMLFERMLLLTNKTKKFIIEDDIENKVICINKIIDILTTLINFTKDDYFIALYTYQIHKISFININNSIKDINHLIDINKKILSFI